MMTADNSPAVPAPDPGPSVTTAKAYFGFWTGLKPTNHRSLYGRPVSAVPVLPATFLPFRLLAVPVLTTWAIISRSWLALLELIGWANSCGLASYSTDWSAALTLSTRYGFMIWPLFAAAAAIIAICSGVARLSPCPIEPSAVGAPRSGGNELAALSTPGSTSILLP